MVRAWCPPHRVVPRARHTDVARARADGGDVELPVFVPPAGGDAAPCRISLRRPSLRNGARVRCATWLNSVFVCVSVWVPVGLYVSVCLSVPLFFCVCTNSSLSTANASQMERVQLYRPYRSLEHPIEKRWSSVQSLRLCLPSSSAWYKAGPSWLTASPNDRSLGGAGAKFPTLLGKPAQL